MIPIIQEIASAQHACASNSILPRLAMTAHTGTIVAATVPTTKQQSKAPSLRGKAAAKDNRSKILGSALPKQTRVAGTILLRTILSLPEPFLAGFPPLQEIASVQHSCASNSILPRLAMTVHTGTIVAATVPSKLSLTPSDCYGGGHCEEVQRSNTRLAMTVLTRQVIEAPPPT